MRAAGQPLPSRLPAFAPTRRSRSRPLSRGPPWGGIPPTSNQAERDLRPAKTQQKISGRLRSEPATRDRYAIRGYISTVAKHGAHVLTASYDALAGNPWMPPIPGPP